MSTEDLGRRELPPLTTLNNKDENETTKWDNGLKKHGKKKIKKNDIGRVLESIREDIVTSDLPYRTFQASSTVCISCTEDHCYMEGSRKFKKTKTSEMKQTTGPSLPSTNLAPNPFTALHFHNAFKTVSLLLNGLLAGIMTWQLVSVFGSSVPTLDHYPPLSLNLHSIYYLITALCTVAALDRFDFSQPPVQIFHQLLSCQSITPLILISSHLIGLLTSLAAVQWDLAIGEHPSNYTDLIDMYSNTTPVTWQVLNTIRAAMTLLAWLLVSMSPKEDKFTQVLKQFEEAVEEPEGVVEN